jgi:glyoxylase-like metal-dependent hydrolase (beta-lactamase superfamily II)
MKLYSINTGHFKLDGGAMFGVVPKSIWNKLNPADENNMCSWAMRCLLIEEGKRLILIDNGMGNKQNEKFFSYYYLHGDDSLDTSLAKHGFHRDDVTDVFLTHLHFDHCGGSIEWNEDKTLLRPAFKNATYWSHSMHWQWAIHPNAREKASFLKENIEPIQQSGQLRFYDEAADFPDWFDATIVSGHTDSMMLPKITINGKTIWYMADLIPSLGHLPIPYVMAYDTQPLKTLDEKSAVLKTALDNNCILFFEHDPVVEACTLIATDRGIRHHETFQLSEWL